VRFSFFSFSNFFFFEQGNYFAAENKHRLIASTNVGSGQSCVKARKSLASSGRFFETLIEMRIEKILLFLFV
jgi:hypothetical protein